MGTQAMADQGMAPQPGGVLLGNVAYIPPGLETYFKDPFSYTITFPNIAQNQTLTLTANIQNDSYFVCTTQTMDIWDAATGNTTQILPQAAAMTCVILDSSSGKQQMDNPVPVGGLFGTGSQPYTWLYRARIFMPGGQLQLQLTSRVAAAQIVRATFTGFKVYKVPDQLVAL